MGRSPRARGIQARGFRRPALIVQGGALNRSRIATVVCVPLTSNVKWAVFFSNENIVQPDLLFVSAARASIIGKNRIQGAPDLIVEIVSEATRRLDETIKRKLYERCGVREYWIVDPKHGIVTSP